MIAVCRRRGVCTAFKPGASPMDEYERYFQVNCTWRCYYTHAHLEFGQPTRAAHTLGIRVIEVVTRPPRRGGARFSIVGQ